MLPMPASCGQGGDELRAAFERVCAFARLDLDMLGDDLEALGLGKAGDGGPLGVSDESKTPDDRPASYDMGEVA
jgi:hypothetical protein